jgi:metal-responsive CopG/Arc/MetJ family transcriptional regulator
MDTVCLILESDLSKGVGRAVREFHYPSKEEFIMEAIREKVKNSKFERFRGSAWHTLLSKHNSEKPKEKNEGYLYRPAFGLKDLIKQQFH